MGDLNVGEAECARCRVRYPLGGRCPWCVPEMPPLAGVEADQPRGLRPLAPEGFVPDAEAAMHAYRRRWHNARTEVDRLRAAIYVLVEHDL